MNAKRQALGRRLLGAVDLAIDFATLGEYGLASPPADRTRDERCGRQAGWEALDGPTAGGGRPRRGARDCRAEPRAATAS